MEHLVADRGACRSAGGRLVDLPTDRLHRNGRAREFDSGRLERSKQPLHRFALNQGWNIRLGRKLDLHSAFRRCNLA